MLTYNDLHEYQKRAVSFIKEKEKCALYLDMGLGKTITTLTAIKELLDECLIRKVLIIAPLRVANSTWHKEIANWQHLENLTYSICTGSEKQRKDALAKNVDIYIINRENTQWLFENKYSFDCIILDESSSFKSPKAKRFKAIKKANYNYMIQLSGTPSPKGLQDLWSQIVLLDKGERLGRTYSLYMSRYFYPDRWGYNYTVKDPKLIYEQIDDITLSMQAADYIELPAHINVVTEIQIPEFKKYKAFQKEFILRIKEEEITASTAAVLTNKLLQYANGAIYDEDKKFIEIHDAKLDALEEIIEDNKNENILVAYNFQSDLVRLKKRFKHAIQLTDDKIIADWNANRIKLLLAHPASCGMGLNLQHGGNNIIWFGMTWNLEHYLQFNARLHRQGQIKPVVINHIISKNTIDEKIIYSLNNKNINLKDLLISLI